MRKLFTSCVSLLIVVGLVWGQGSTPPGVIYVTATPSGACGYSQIRIVRSTGAAYTCKAGTWTALSSAATVTAGAGLSLVDSVMSIDTTIIPTFLTASASLSFSAISASPACASLTFTLPGAAVNDTVIAGWPATLEDGVWGKGSMRVSTANTIEVRLCNNTGSPITPAAGQTFVATIIRGF